MSDTASAAGTSPAVKPAMNVFERFLTFWVALCIIVGIALGQMLPRVFHTLGDATIAQVNIPVAVLVWLMIVPMLLKIDLAALGQVGQHWRGIASTVGVNWLVKPFSMALLAWIFIAHLFRPWLPADQIASYTAGLILLAAAPCTAMVFVWSNLVDGEPHFTSESGRAQRHDHGGGVRADRRAAARSFLDHGAMGHAHSFGRALHRGAGDRGAALACCRAAAGRSIGSGAHIGPARPALSLRAAG